MIKKYAYTILIIAFFTTSAIWAQTNVVHGELIVFNDNGVWSWFSDERAIMDVAGGKLLVSSVAHQNGAGGADRHGDVDVVSYELETEEIQRFVLHDSLEADDHNNAAFEIRPDGRYIAMYSRHGRDVRSRYRISVNPHDATAWQPKQFNSNYSDTTYSNPFFLPAENDGNGRMYCFTRMRDWDPHLLISDDFGENWSYGGRLIQGPGRPYVKYTSNGLDTIHFITTEQHPRNYDNSIYHAYIRGGKMYSSSGEMIDDDIYDGYVLTSTGPSPEELTQVFAGDAGNVAWTSDIHLNEDGHPFIAFSVQKDGEGQPIDGGGMDHRYHYAQFDGEQWHQYEMCYGGSRLYADEADYTGNIALDPDDPDRVFISADVDPDTGNPLISSVDGQRHYEIFEGVTSDNGRSWTWTQITENSSVDNIRPIIPAWDGSHTALIWLRGTYTTYADWNMQVVGLMMHEDRTVNGIPYIWLAQHDLPTDGSADLSDPQGKGMTVLQDYIADTDPNNPDDVFEAIAFHADEEGTAVRFESSAERVYTLYATHDLIRGDWVPVPGAELCLGQGGIDVLRDINQPPIGNIYRLEVALP